VSGPDFHRALVIRGGALGDFLLTLPVLVSLREAAPQARLEVMAYPGIAALARAGGLVDDARSIEYGPLAGFFTRGALLDPPLRDYFASFDLIISYLYDPDGIFAANLRASGVSRLVEGSPRVGERSHAVDQLAAPLAGLGIPLAGRAARLDIPPADRESRSIFLHPGSGSPSKNWAPGNWRALAGQLLDGDQGRRLTIVGGEADAVALGPLRDLAGRERVRWLENLPLPELAAELGRADAYLGHDTGISHLAAVTGVPSLLLFGPTDPGVWAPPHGHVRVLRAPDGNLEVLGVDTVLRAARNLPGLARHRPGGNIPDR